MDSRLRQSNVGKWAQNTKHAGPQHRLQVIGPKPSGELAQGVWTATLAAIPQKIRRRQAAETPYATPRWGGMCRIRSNVEFKYIIKGGLGSSGVPDLEGPDAPTPLDFSMSILAILCTPP
jgi:hypothetical protein